MNEKDVTRKRERERKGDQKFPGQYEVPTIDYRFLSNARFQEGPPGYFVFKALCDIRSALLTIKFIYRCNLLFYSFLLVKTQNLRALFYRIIEALFDVLCDDHAMNIIHFY